MNKNMYNQLTIYIEENKTFNNISYKETIDYLKELIKTIEEEYKTEDLLEEGVEDDR